MVESTAINRYRPEINKIITIVLFVIYPLLALPFIFIEIYNRRRYALSLLAIYLGYFAMLYAPTGDLYRYFQDFTFYQNLSFAEFKLSMSNKMDFMQPFLFWGMAKLGFTCDATRFLYVYISSELLFSIYYDITEKSKNSQIVNLLLLLLLLLFVKYERFTVRFGMSTMFFTFGWYKILFCNKKWYWLLILLSILNHFSFILPVMAFVGARIINFQPKRWVFICLFIGSFILSGDYLSGIISLLPFDENIINHLLAYTDGYWAGEFLDDHSARFSLGRNLLKLPYFIFTFLLIKDYEVNKITGTIVASMLLLFVFAAFITIQSRLQQVYVFQALIYLLSKGDSYLKCKKHIIYAFSLGFIYLFLCTWTMRRELSLSQEKKLLYPTYSIWTSPFTEEWVDYKVFTDGAPDVKF